MVTQEYLKEVLDLEDSYDEDVQFTLNELNFNRSDSRFYLSDDFE